MKNVSSLTAPNVCKQAYLPEREVWSLPRLQTGGCRPRSATSPECGGLLGVDPAESADRTPGGPDDQDIKGSAPLPCGRGGDANCATSDHHPYRIYPMGRERAGRRGRAAAAAPHRSFGGARLCRPELSIATREAKILVNTLTFTSSRGAFTSQSGVGRPPEVYGPFGGLEARDCTLARCRTMTGQGGALACLLVQLFDHSRTTRASKYVAMPRRFVGIEPNMITKCPCHGAIDIDTDDAHM